MDTCYKCGKEIFEEDESYFENNEGMILCDQCGHEELTSCNEYDFWVFDSDSREYYSDDDLTDLETFIYKKHKNCN